MIVKYAGCDVGDPKIRHDGATSQIQRPAFDRMQQQTADPQPSDALVHDKIGQPEGLLSSVKFETSAIGGKAEDNATLLRHKNVEPSLRPETGR